MSMPEALTALISKYLDCVIAADQAELVEFFAKLVSRSKVNEAINALLSARELAFVLVGSSSKIQIAPPRVASVRSKPGASHLFNAEDAEERRGKPEKNTETQPREKG
jgi:hypothetical protein